MRYRKYIEDVPDRLNLELRSHNRKWDDISQLRTVSDGHYGHRANVEIDVSAVQSKLQAGSRIRQFNKTPKRSFKCATNVRSQLVRVGTELAQLHFETYTSDIHLMANIPPYDYRIAACNAIAEVPVVDNNRTITDPECSRFTATICWVKLTELLDGLYGERLDPDYINLLDRATLSVRLRRVGAYAEINFAYDYTNILDIVYPVKHPEKWVKYPQSWGELTFCCLWRRQQSQFFKKLTETITYEHNGQPQQVERPFYF